MRADVRLLQVGAGCIGRLATDDINRSSGKLRLRCYSSRHGGRKRGSRRRADGRRCAAPVDREAASAGAHGPVEAAVACRNCGATVTGKFCSECAQPAHIHRSLLSLTHDVLHSVFHFDGKLWRTVPALVLHPGELTRRYIDGERAKFVSPMALFLFTVFTMFAVFSFVGRRRRSLPETTSPMSNPAIARRSRQRTGRFQIFGSVLPIQGWRPISAPRSSGRSQISNPGVQ